VAGAVFSIQPLQRETRRWGVVAAQYLQDGRDVRLETRSSGQAGRCAAESAAGVAVSHDAGGRGPRTPEHRTSARLVVPSTSGAQEAGRSRSVQIAERAAAQDENACSSSSAEYSDTMK